METHLLLKLLKISKPVLQNNIKGLELKTFLICCIYAQIYCNQLTTEHVNVIIRNMSFLLQVNMKMREITEREHKVKHHPLESPSHQKVNSDVRLLVFVFFVFFYRREIQKSKIHEPNDQEVSASSSIFLIFWN